MVSNDNDVGVAMALVIGAGAATGVGASVVFFPSLVKFASRKTLAGALGLSAGVMVYVSFAEIFLKSQDSFEDANFSEDQAKLYATLCFFAGVVAMVALNHLVTTLLGGHHHHHHQTEEVVGRSTMRANTTNSKVDSLQDEPEDEPPTTTDNNNKNTATADIPPCICHDDHPTETLDKLQHMAESMKAHPDRPHPQGLVASSDTNDKETTTSGPEPQEENENDNNKEEEEYKEEIGEPANTANAKSSLKDGVEDKELEDEDYDDDDDDEGATVTKNNRKLMLMSLNTALAIGLHNFPEGLATFVAALDDPKVGAVLAIAIAIHNIPEGLCVAMPIYYATGNKWKAFGWACLSGIAEPIAGLFGWLVLAQSFSDQLYALLFGMVAGMMVIISVRELLPTAHRYDPDDSVVTYCFIGGMGIMALSLMLFLL